MYVGVCESACVCECKFNGKEDELVTDKNIIMGVTGWAKVDRSVKHDRMKDITTWGSNHRQTQM